MSMRMNVACAAAVAALLGSATGLCIAMTSARAENAAVKIDNFTFDPRNVTVKAGTTVVWTNQDDSPHAVLSTTKQFKSRALDTEDTFSVTFTTPGTYEYFCSLHPHMTGSIVVEAATGDGAAP